MTRLRDNERYIADREHEVALGQALTNLHKNKDFKKLFTEFLFATEFERNSLLAVNDGVMMPEDRQAARNNADALMRLKLLLVEVERKAVQAKTDLERFRLEVEIQE